MNERNFIDMQSLVNKKYGIDISIGPEDIQEYLELIESWGYRSKAISKKEKKELEISELHCVYWGLLHLSTGTENTIVYDYIHKINACICTFIPTTILMSFIVLIFLPVSFANRIKGKTL